jgi:hypothetical protein
MIVISEVVIIITPRLDYKTMIDFKWWCCWWKITLNASVEQLVINKKQNEKKRNFRSLEWLKVKNRNCNCWLLKEEWLGKDV